MAKKVLVVDDESNIVDILRFNLQREGYEVVAAYDGQEGLDKARSEAPDLILLDVMLPEKDGFQVCEELRKTDRLTPIIMLTAREEERDRVMGLELGADDYVVKPFSVRELMARVRTNIRRTAVMTEETAEAGEDHLLRAGRLTVDPDRQIVLKDGQSVDVSQREFELLRLLAASVGTVFSREQLLSQVWNYDYYGDTRAVDVAVRRLREKLEDDPAAPSLLCTRRGGGYYLSGE
ncbi:MAG: response regulator transcription factor [Oscillospiraceae bacterium]|nr:response regulator transcription factor [Oscillospiraceae bacterium]